MELIDVSWKGIRLWNLQTGAPTLISTRPGLEKWIFETAISKDGRWFAASDGSAGLEFYDMDLPDPAASPILLKGHAQEITALHLSPDSSLLASGDEQGNACVWRVPPVLNDAAPLCSLAADNKVRTLAISPNSRWIVAATWDVHHLHRWELTSPDPAAAHKTLTGHTSLVSSVAFSHDSVHLATGSLDETARVWKIGHDDPVAGCVVLPGHAADIEAVTFSPDGRRLVTGSDDHKLRLWDLNSDKYADRPPTILHGHEAGVRAAAFSPDGRWIVTGGGWDNLARLWRVQRPIGYPLTYSSLVYFDSPLSPDKSILVSAVDERTARLSFLNQPDLTNREVLFGGHKDRINDIAFSPSGRWFATGGRDHAVRLWDLNQAENQPQAAAQELAGHETSLKHLAFSRNEEFLLSADHQGGIDLWDLRQAPPKLQPVAPAGWGIKEIAVSADFHSVAAGGDWGRDGNNADNTTHVRLWNIETKTALAPFVDLKAHKSVIDGVAFSPDGNWLFTRSYEDSCRGCLWSVGQAKQTRDPRPLVDLQDAEEVHFSRDSRWMAVTGRFYGGPCRLLRLASELKPREASFKPVRFSIRDEILFTSGENADLHCWNLAAVSASPLVLSTDGERVARIDLSPSGRWLVACCGEKNSTIYVWDTVTLTMPSTRRVLGGHEGEVMGVAFSAQEDRLATLAHEAKIWKLVGPDTDSAAFPIVLDCPGGAHTAELCFCDGNRRLVANLRGHDTLVVWELDVGRLIELARRTAGRNLTRQEWNLFLGGRSYRETFPGLPVHDADIPLREPLIAAPPLGN